MHFNDRGQKQEMIDQLMAQHAALQARVHELEQHLALSPTEQLEVARLKKLKLRAKEQLYRLAPSRYASRR